MSPETLKFLAFTAFGAASLAAGYAARKRGWVTEDASKPMHWHTVVWIWPLAAVFSIWNLPLRADTLWFIPLEFVLVALPAFVTILLARLIGCDDRRTGVLAIGAGLGNLGFTLGGYLCFALIDPPREALAYAVAQVMLMTTFGFMVLYPLAMHFGPPDARPAGSAARLVVRSIFDLRSMQLWGALLGVLLAASPLDAPTQVFDWHLLDAVFFLGAFTGYFGIGLRLRLGDSAHYLKEHALLAAMKFLFIPALSATCLALIALTPVPLAPNARHVVMIEAFMPTAIQTVITANLFHLDARLASVAWVWNAVIFAVVVLPVLLVVMG